MKKLLYLSDLYNFYVTQNKNVKFSSKDNDTTIVVHIDEPFTYSKNEENDLLMYTPIRLCHTLTNKNKSHIPEKAMEDAMSSAYNMPILGYIYKDENETFQFAGHEFFVNEDNELEYEEQPCGTIPESAGLKLVKYDNDDRSYLEGTGIIWRTYSKASDIIEREKELSVSVELVVDELSFDSKTKELVINKFRFSGVTILGKDRNTGEDIKPGMENSMISIGDFSEKNNSIFSQNEKVIEMLSALNEKIDNLNINSKILEEGGTDVKKKFEEDSEAKVKTTAEVDPTEETEVGTPSENFDGDGDTDPDDVDYYGDDGDGDPSGDGDDTPSGDDTDPEPEPSGDDEDEPEGIPAGQKDDDDADGGEGGGTTKKPTFSVSVSHGETVKEFSISLQDKIEALYTLVNDTYSEADGCYYDCTVYDEDKYVIMSSWWTGNAYKQSYKVKKDVYSLVGDRVKVKAVWCTEDEEKALENMRANYSSIEEKLAQYESEPEKIQILESADYAQIKDTEAYKELAKRDTYFSMSKDELVKKLDSALLEFAKHNKIEFSSTEPEKKSVGMKLFGNPSKKTTRGSSRYGELFSK